MYKLLRPVRWLLKETGKIIEFTGSEVSTCGKKLEDLGEDILKELERTGYIAKDTSNTGAAEPKIEPAELNEATEVDDKVSKKGKKKGK